MSIDIFENMSLNVIFKHPICSVIFTVFYATALKSLINDVLRVNLSHPEMFPTCFISKRHHTSAPDVMAIYNVIRMAPGNCSPSEFILIFWSCFFIGCLVLGFFIASYVNLSAGLVLATIVGLRLLQRQVIIRILSKTWSLNIVSGENSPGSFRCSCSRGLLLNMDGFSCMDINECENPADNACEQVCRPLHLHRVYAKMD